MTDTPAPDAAVQIAGKAVNWRLNRSTVEAQVAALAAAGWLHDPAEVAALRAVAKRTYRDLMTPEERASVGERNRRAWDTLDAPLLADGARQPGPAGLPDPAKRLLSDILAIVNRHQGRNAEQAMAEIHATLASFVDAAPAAPQPATAAEVPA